MTVKLLLFAAASEMVGKSSVEVELDEGATVADLREWLQRSYPGMAALMSSSNWSVNQSYVNLDHRLTDGCEVGLIVPVSGG